MRFMLSMDPTAPSFASFSAIFLTFISSWYCFNRFSFLFLEGSMPWNLWHKSRNASFGVIFRPNSSNLSRWKSNFLPSCDPLGIAAASRDRCNANGFLSFVRPSHISVSFSLPVSFKSARVAAKPLEAVEASPMPPRFTLCSTGGGGGGGGIGALSTTISSSRGGGGGGASSFASTGSSASSKSATWIPCTNSCVSLNTTPGASAPMRVSTKGSPRSSAKRRSATANTSASPFAPLAALATCLRDRASARSSSKSSSS
mmetsp:Transcript_11536/g.42733  ORF Transcript_11536/g.42733 Transcript_11536/m.42733 type:complete len:258 (-) Transcript_11536:1337-2110(-)